MPLQTKLKPLNLRRLLQNHAPFLAVVAGFLLVAFTLGPFTNGDTDWELDATQGVLRAGLPVANVSYLIDQPPVGFYVQAGWACVFGLSFSAGTVLTALSGALCLVLLYIIGLELYDRTVGVLAAALMAFTPWHLILSRAYLIDVQCLFFSLLSLAVAVYAYKRSSFKLFALSGIAFAVAFNTKLYAVFTLIPILALFLFHHPKKPAASAGWLAAFSAPTLVSSFLWYHTITATGLKSIVFHTDFTIHNAAASAPSALFALNFLLDYGVGLFFFSVAVLSFVLAFVCRSRFRRFLTVDAICAATVIVVVAVDTVLGAALNLKPPYQNAIKYCYQALPYFALLAAVLCRKSLQLIDGANNGSRVLRVFGGLCLFLVAGALVFNMRYVNLLSGADFVIFRVQPNVDVGYSFFVAHPLTASSPLLYVQVLGFALGVLGLVWLSRNRLRVWFRR